MRSAAEAAPRGALSTIYELVSVTEGQSEQGKFQASWAPLRRVLSVMA
jgi:hypothetical protein